MRKQDRPVSHSIELNIATELSDKEFRDAYFRAELEVDIPRQIKALRKLRGLTQKELAEAAHTKQSAISRLETADYGKWGVETLLGLAEALGARMSVVFRPYEEVAAEYLRGAREPRPSAATGDTNRRGQAGFEKAMPGPQPKGQTANDISAEGKRESALN